MLWVCVCVCVCACVCVRVLSTGSGLWNPEVRRDTRSENFKLHVHSSSCISYMKDEKQWLLCSSQERPNTNEINKYSCGLRPMKKKIGTTHWLLGDLVFMSYLEFHGYELA